MKFPVINGFYKLPVVFQVDMVKLRRYYYCYELSGNVCVPGVL